MKVDIGRLTEFSCYKSCFELINRIVTVILNFEDLFAYN